MTGPMGRRSICGTSVPNCRCICASELALAPGGMTNLLFSQGSMFWIFLEDRDNLRGTALDGAFALGFRVRVGQTSREDLRVTISAGMYRRADQVAFTINAHLPEGYQAEILEEQLRIAREVLLPRGLARRKVLVMGGAGYIGSVLTGRLLQAGYQVRCSDLLLYRNGVTVTPFLDHPDYEFMRCDLVDTARLERAFADVTDVVVLAGLVGDPITKKYPEASGRINDDGILRLIDFCNGQCLNRVIFVSTCSNYGLIPEDTTADEDFELNPLSLYAKSKVAAEQKLLALEGKVDYQPTVLRFATAFGLSPRMRFDLTVSEFTRAMFRGEDLLVYDAHTWRPYCHLKDFSEAIRRVIEAPVDRGAFEAFNAGGDVNNATKQTIVDTIKSYLPEAPVHYQAHGADPRNYRVNFGKIKRVLHFEPSMMVRDGVAELLGALGQGLFSDVEANKPFYGNYEIAYP